MEGGGGEGEKGKNAVKMVHVLCKYRPAYMYMYMYIVYGYMYMYVKFCT